jgi:hypothetical protein
MKRQWLGGLAAVVALAACRAPATGRPPATNRPPATSPQATVVVPDVPPEPAPPPPVACPLVPVSLVVTPSGAEPRTVLALDDKGRLDISMFRHRSGAATLDTKGCLAGSDGLWAEWAPRDQVWTPHETLAVAGNCMMLADGRTLCLGADGKVELRAMDLADVRAMGAMQIRGYRAEARCAGLVLLATFMSMTPEMAGVDARPPRAPAPAPEGSRCTAYHRP